MGLFGDTLNVVDQNMIRSIGPEIVHSIRRASYELSTNTTEAASHSYYWFGIMDPEWLSVLALMLNRMASIINLHKFNVGAMPLCHRNEYSRSALARPPLSGWRLNICNVSGFPLQGYGFITRSENELFQILLDNAWLYLPKYRTCSGHGINKGCRHDDCTAIHSSQFNTIAHELSHLVIGTKDHIYGYQESLDLAKYTPKLARHNADNWAFFIEEFR